ncbi:MAG TPA: hypothetical protein VHA52_13375, partial [Candidatus Babeliaceae bacterium]|nr:hypothetical protein [Candidatus Babeliaceae bacterium]
MVIAAMVSFQTVKAQFSKARYNRFNYHTYRWQVLCASAYNLYFPKGYDSLASFVSLHLPDIMQTVKKAVGGTLEQPPNIIIHPALTQFYESNIGMNEEKIRTFPTKTEGNRITVAFNGSYEQFLQE